MLSVSLMYIECYLLPLPHIQGACTELISEIVITGIITQPRKYLRGKRSHP